MFASYRRFAVAFGALCALAFAGCTAIFGLDAGQPFPSTGGGSGGSAGAGAGGNAGAGGQDGCATTAECDDEKPCTTDSCDPGTHLCAHVNVPNALAPAQNQVVGDCEQLFCVDGALVPARDDLDVPNDHKQCTSDACSEGAPTLTAVALGTPCDDDGGSVCNGDTQSPACVACNVPSDCGGLPADDECQTRVCDAGAHTCGQAFTAADTAVAGQVTGNCKVHVCDGNGGQRDNVDPGDLPVDGNDCTDDLCDASGDPDNPPSALNAPCGANGSLFCDGAGSCAGCTNDAQCSPDTFCRDYGCNVVSHNCGFSARNNASALPSPPTFGGDPDQVAGDCQQLRCDAAGNITSVALNSDVPADDGNQCTNEVCASGVPAHPNSAIDVACSQSGGSFCSGNGTCVACNQSPQCGDPSCLCRVCSANVCVNVANNTSAACQTAGDCQTRVCNGSGGTAGTANNSDLPADDGNVCTTEQCVAGVVQHTNNTAACNDSLFCNGSDTCAGGSCSAHTGDPCTPLNTSDNNCAKSCNEATDSCNANDPSGTGCNDGIFCNGSDHCNASGSCATHSGDPCLPLVTTDGNCAQSCNESTDSCSANDPNGTACSDGTFCNGADTCATGGCTTHAGNPCSGHNTGPLCEDSCNEAADACTAADVAGIACNEAGPGQCSGSLTEPNCAGALSAVSVTPSSLVRSTTNSAVIEFTTVHSWPANGRLTVGLPGGFSAPAVGYLGSPNVNGTVSVSQVGQSLVFVRAGNGTAVASNIHVLIQIANLTNPSALGLTGPFLVETQVSSATRIDSGTAPGVNITFL